MYIFSALVFLPIYTIYGLYLRQIYITLVFLTHLGIIVLSPIYSDRLLVTHLRGSTVLLPIFVACIFYHPLKRLACFVTLLRSSPVLWAIFAAAHLFCDQFTQLACFVTHLRGSPYLSPINAAHLFCRPFTRLAGFITHLRGSPVLSPIYGPRLFCHTFPEFLICCSFINPSKINRLPSSVVYNYLEFTISRTLNVEFWGW